MREHDVIQTSCRNLMHRLEAVCLGLRASGSESAADVACLIDDYISATVELSCSHSHRMAVVEQRLGGDGADAAERGSKGSDECSTMLACECLGCEGDALAAMR